MAKHDGEVRARRPEPPAYAGPMRFVRVWLPVVVTVPGLAFMVLGFALDRITWMEGGAGLVGAGLSIWLLNFFYRMSAAERERDEEDAARQFFDRHGRWPDEPPPHR